MSLIAPTLQLFFTERLIKQRQGSPATVRSYRSVGSQIDLSGMGADVSQSTGVGERECRGKLTRKTG